MKQFTLALSHSDAEAIRTALFRSYLDHELQATHAEANLNYDSEDSQYYHYVYTEEKATAEALETLYHTFSFAVIDAELDANIAVSF